MKNEKKIKATEFLVESEKFEILEEVREKSGNLYQTDNEGYAQLLKSYFSL